MPVVAGWMQRLGFVFSQSDPFAGIDLDAIVASANSGHAERFSAPNMEISPSGLGLKMWVPTLDAFRTFGAKGVEMVPWFCRAAQ